LIAVAYRVTGAFVQVTSAGPTGEQKIALYQGAILPGDVPADEVRHHLSVNMIEEVGADEGPTGGPLEAVLPPSLVQPAPAVPGVAAVADDDPERAKAREKLPADGSAPHRNASEAVWVEYAVKRGHSLADARAAGKEELVKLLAK
jgi:hypothetical protein